MPTTSTESPGTSIRTACRSIASASPASSCTVSPLARRATRNAASWTGVVSPLITWSIAHSASPWARSRRASSADTSPGQVGAAGVGTDMAQPRRRRASNATASAIATGSTGSGTAKSARDHVASQASCGRPVSTRIGGQ